MFCVTLKNDLQAPYAFKASLLLLASLKSSALPLNTESYFLFFLLLEMISVLALYYKVIAVQDKLKFLHNLQEDSAANVA